METPCIRVCKLDNSGVCIGCGRTQEQLRMWTTYTDEQRQKIMESINGTAASQDQDSEDYDKA